jgi:hypothetical protein
MAKAISEILRGVLAGNPGDYFYWRSRGAKGRNWAYVCGLALLYGAPFVIIHG